MYVTKCCLNFNEGTYVYTYIYTAYYKSSHIFLYMYIQTLRTEYREEPQCLCSLHTTFHLNTSEPILIRYGLSRAHIYIHTNIEQQQQSQHTYQHTFNTHWKQNEKIKSRGICFVIGIFYFYNFSLSHYLLAKTKKQTTAKSYFIFIATFMIVLSSSNCSHTYTPTYTYACVGMSRAWRCAWLLIYDHSAQFCVLYVCVWVCSVV